MEKALKLAMVWGHGVAEGCCGRCQYLVPSESVLARSCGEQAEGDPEACRGHMAVEERSSKPDAGIPPTNITLAQAQRVKEQGKQGKLL